MSFLYSHYGIASDIFIFDEEHRNRAIDGDIVVVDIIPPHSWKAPSPTLGPGGSKAKDGTTLNLI